MSNELLIERVQQQLDVYITANEDWMTDSKKSEVVASFNNNLASLRNMAGNVTDLILK
jgi:formylglycine-generating enzyme required for sulfatase activity